MKKLTILLSLLLLTNCAKQDQTNDNFDFTTVFEKSNGLETPTYQEIIAYYKNLANRHATINLQEIGETDSGHPLHIVTFNPEATFNFEELHKSKNILLINNGIHPGESDGIDASMLLFRDFAEKKIKIPENTVIVAIPVYNVGGALNRNSGTRTNQNGPKAYGFRGNGRNYDLNRDFIKNDTRNAQSFAKIFHKVNPDLFIDNHVSNGADYQYTLTHLFTQHNKLGSEIGSYLHTELQPQLEASLAEKKWDITPYVNVWGTTPDKGWSQFMDSPRYSTGYTTLWNTPGLMVETHMLKPYKKRVEGTYELLLSAIEILEKDGTTIKKLKNESTNHWKTAKEYPITWKVDTSKSTTFNFKGYEGEFIDSKITGKQRLKYDRNKPSTKKVNYKNYFTPSNTITIPKAYILPKGWWNIKNLLDINNMRYSALAKDSMINVEVLKIEEFETQNNPFEGHYIHYNTKVKRSSQNITFYKGDLIIPTDQEGIRYLLETLEPEAPDSFFNWNFFDTILQQKEGFSPYIWEDKAYELLQNDPKLRDKFEEKRKDTTFANNWYAQLDWIYKQSNNYEKAHLRYPVFRILK